MSERVTEWLVKILLPLGGAIALIIGALVSTEKAIAAFLVFLLILHGIWSIVDPESAFMFGNRWMFKQAEPSDLALLLTQIGGIITIIASIIILLIVLFRY